MASPSEVSDSDLVSSGAQFWESASTSGSDGAGGVNVGVFLEDL